MLKGKLLYYDSNTVFKNQVKSQLNWFIVEMPFLNLGLEEIFFKLNNVAKCTFPCILVSVLRFYLELVQYF